MNQFINKLNLFHVSWSLSKWNITTLTYCIIQCYLLLLSFLPWLKTSLWIKVRDEKKLRIAQVCSFLCLKFLISAGENKDKKVMLSLRNKMTINLMSARLSNSINMIQSWTTSKKKKKKKQERSLIPKSNFFVGD